MVLQPEDIEAGLPGVDMRLDDGGYTDNESAADNTPDPGDTGADLEAQGRIEGYSYNYSNPADPVFSFSSSSPADPVVVTVGTSVDLFDTPESASAFIQRQMDDLRRFAEESDEIVLEEFQESVTPDLGDDTVAAWLILDPADEENKSSGALVMWRRGPVIALLGILSRGGQDRSADVEELVRQTEELALRMDQRIDGVLAGEITAAPITPTPAHTSQAFLTASNGPDEDVPLEGYNLPEMLISLADLPEGTVIDVEGFVGGPGPSREYEREFASEGPIINLGSSRIINIITRVRLYANTLDASNNVLIASTLPRNPQVFVGFAGDVFADFDPENIDVMPLELPPIGHVSAGFLVKIETEQVDIEGHMVYFAGGRVAAEVFFFGPSGKISVADTLPLVKLIDQRIKENSHPAR